MVFLLKNLNIVTLITQKDSKTIVDKKEQKSDNIFYIKLRSKDSSVKRAMLSIKEDNYILLKGSYIQYECWPSLKQNSSPYKNRNSLIERKLVKKVDGYYQVQKDIPYNSCSLPAAVVRGRNSNGRIEWKLEDGTTIADIEKRNYNIK